MCRFCLQTVDIKHAAGLFTPKAVLEDLPGRMSRLLQVPVRANENLSEYIAGVANLQLLPSKRSSRS